MPFTNTVDTHSRLPHVEGMMAVAALRTQPEFAMPPKEPARFPRTARLLRHADFERVYKQGRRHFSATMTVFYLARTEEDIKTRAGAPSPQGLRIGFTVGRALGGAVQRNRMKRRLREAVRMSRPATGVGADVVINPKKSLLAADFSAVVNEVSRAFVVIERKLSEKGASALKANSTDAARKPEAGSRS